jgi:predicted nucleotidyltransferase
MDLFEQLKANKFPYTNNLIHLFRGGSDLHGAQLVNKHDDDWYGVYVEPPEMVIGLKDYPHYVWSSAGDTKRNVPGDMDICFYSLRKWAKLASGGNPTCLSYLFAENTIGTGDVDLWGEVRLMRTLFLSKSCAEQFGGFALAQRQRYMGERGQGKHGQRPELETKFGFDTKAAMHVMRLLGEGIELMRTGEITYPRPNKDILIAVREGKYDMEFLKDMTDHLFHDLDVVQAESSLPDQVDREAISQFLTKFYLKVWGKSDAATNRVLARAVDLASRWIAGHLRADPRVDGHPQWEEWRDESVVKLAMIDMAMRAED